MVDVFTSVIGDVVPITVLLLLISASIYAITYMVSKILNNEQLRKWTETEIYQSFATASILFFAVAFFTLFLNFSDVFMQELIKLEGLDNLYLHMTTPTTGTNDANLDALFDESTAEEGEKLLTSDMHMKYAYVFLLSQLNELNAVYDISMGINSVLGTASSVFFPEFGDALGISISRSALKDSVFGYLYYGFMFTYMQLAMLDLIKAFFLFMFPVGIFLRAFPLTNSVGSAMIAMSVGLYFIYPLILGVLLITNYEQLDITEHEIVKMAKSEEPSEFVEYYIQTKIHYEDINPISGSAPVKTFTDSFDFITSFVEKILLNMFLFPLVAFTLTYTFIHAFAGFMQANVSEMGRGLIRLV